jgi:hypothetical protein
MEKITGNVTNGKGRKELSNQDYYDGIWKDGKFIEGIMRHSYGKGWRYEGQAYRDSKGLLQKHGVGKEFKDNKLVFEGVFNNSEWGEGQYNLDVTLDDGTKITGDVKNGRGRKDYPNKDFMEGIWKNAELIEGDVRLTNNKGYVYVGKYKNNERHGIGKLFNPDGTINYEGYFLYGNKKEWYDEIEKLIKKIADKKGFSKLSSIKKQVSNIINLIFKQKTETVKNKNESIEQLNSKFLSKQYKAYIQNFMNLYFAGELEPIDKQVDIVIKFLKSIKELYGYSDEYNSLLNKFYYQIKHVELTKMIAERWLHEIKEIVSLFGSRDYDDIGRVCFSEKQFIWDLKRGGWTTDEDMKGYVFPADKDDYNIKRFKLIKEYIVIYKDLKFVNDRNDKYIDELLLKIKNTEYYWSRPKSISNTPRNKDGSLDKRYTKNR